MHTVTVAVNKLPFGRPSYKTDWQPLFSICSVSANKKARPLGIGLKEMQQTKQTWKLYV
jgi:hypothetical protein